MILIWYGAKILLIIELKKSDIVASKWLKAIRNNEIEKILPSSLGRLKKYDIWWYNFALVKKYLETSNNQNLNDLKTVIGYYGENALLLTQMGLKYPTRINEKLIKELILSKYLDYCDDTLNFMFVF